MSSNSVKFGMLHSTAGRDPNNTFQSAQPTAQAQAPVSATTFMNNSTSGRSGFAAFNPSSESRPQQNPFLTAVSPSPMATPVANKMQSIFETNLQSQSSNVFPTHVPGFKGSIFGETSSTTSNFPAPWTIAPANAMTFGVRPTSWNPRQQHVGVFCDGCGQHPTNIVGIRYKCSSCPNFDLCASCMDKYDAGEELPNRCASHPRNHYFIRLPRDVGTAPPAAFANREAWVHHNVSCAECRTASIVGYRYFCTVCATSYCEVCEQRGLGCARSQGHSVQHSLLKMVPPQRD